MSNYLLTFVLLTENNMTEIEQNYHSLLKSGMFWEFHPHLTGEWEKDKEWFTAYILEDMNCGDCKLCVDNTCFEN